MSNMQKYFPKLCDFSLMCIKGGAAVSFAAALCSYLLYNAYTYYKFAGYAMYQCALSLCSYSFICLIESAALAFILNLVIKRLQK